MPLDLSFVVHTKPLFGVLVQKLVQEVSGLRRNVGRNLQLGCLDVFVELFDILSVVRRKSNQELIEDCANLIDITRLAHTFAEKHFGGKVSWTATKGLCLTLVIYSFFCETKISKFDVAI